MKSIRTFLSNLADVAKDFNSEIAGKKKSEELLNKSGLISQLDALASMPGSTFKYSKSSDFGIIRLDTNVPLQNWPELPSKKPTFLSVQIRGDKEKGISVSGDFSIGPDGKPNDVEHVESNAAGIESILSLVTEKARARGLIPQSSANGKPSTGFNPST